MCSSSGSRCKPVCVFTCSFPTSSFGLAHEGVVLVRAMVSLESLNDGVNMVGRSWTEFSSNSDADLDARILVHCLREHDNFDCSPPPPPPR